MISNDKLDEFCDFFNLMINQYEKFEKGTHCFDISMQLHFHLHTYDCRDWKTPKHKYYKSFTLAGNIKERCFSNGKQVSQARFC